MSTTITGWHFAGKTLKDGRPLPKKGESIWHNETMIIPCPSEDEVRRGYGGLHASERALDALHYAPGCLVARVRLSGVIVSHGAPVDKYAASERTTLTDYADATEVIREFARLCALDAARIYAADAMDKIGLTDQAAMLRALSDEATCKTIGAVALVAETATRNATWAAGVSRYVIWAAENAGNTAGAADAARNAADAARHAADNALSAAWYANWAARDAAWAARDAARAIGDAARATGDAHEACRERQNEQLTKMLEELITGLHVTAFVSST